MFVSRVRETTDHSNERALAVDVVFHPWVLRSCKGEPMFRDQARVAHAPTTSVGSAALDAICSNSLVGCIVRGYNQRQLCVSQVVL